MLVSIKNGVYKGVYRYETRDEFRQYAELLKGSSHRFFEDSEEAQALTWAGEKLVRELSDIVSSDEPSDPVFSEFLGDFATKNANKRTKNPSTVSDGWVCGSGHKNIEKSNFCIVCGDPRNAPSNSKELLSESVWVCSNGHTNAENYNFCLECGEKKSAPPQQVPPSTPSSVSETASTESNTETIEKNWVCSNGHANAEHYNFCLECGEKKSEPSTITVPEDPFVKTDSADWTCSNGHTNSENYNFCLECGERRPVSETPLVEPHSDNHKEMLIEETALDAPEQQVDSEVPVRPSVMDVASLDTVDYKSIVANVCKLREGTICEILTIIQETQFHFANIVLDTNETLFVPINDIFYASPDLNISAMSDDEIATALAEKRIRVIPSAFVYPRKTYTIIDNWFPHVSKDIKHMFKGTRNLEFVFSSAVKSISGVFAENNVIDSSEEGEPKKYKLVTSVSAINKLRTLVEML